MRVFALPDVARDRLVEREVGQAVLAVQLRRPQVDPVAPGDLAVDGTGAAVRAGRAGLFLRRQALHFHVRVHDGVERARHLRLDPVEPLVDERHDLGAARIAVREHVSRILRERLHPLADAALRVPDLLQDAVHLRVQRGQLALAHLVHLVRRHRRRRRGLERPAVEVLAVRTRRDAGVARGDGALRAAVRPAAVRARARSPSSRSSALAPPSRRRCSCSSSAARSTRRRSRPRARSSPTRSSAPSPCRGGTPAARHPPPRAAWIRPSSPSSCFANDCRRARYASASAAVSIGWSLSRYRGRSRYAPTF